MLCISSTPLSTGYPSTHMSMPVSTIGIAEAETHS
jgi:hypothetical protein